MVRVITIMDDVYEDLKELKNAKNMSFTEAIRFLLKEKRNESTLINLAGTIEEKDMYRRTTDRIRRGEYNWVDK